MRRILIAPLLLALTAAACSGGASASGPAPPCPPRHILRAGESLPDCSFERMGGGLLALSSLRGSPAILNFWASWCPSCVREMPAFQRIHTQFENRLQVVGFNALGVRGETKAFAKSYAEARGVTYEIAFDRNAVLYSHFAGTSLRPVLPLTVFADARGIVRKVSFGETTESDIRSTISQLFQIA